MVVRRWLAGHVAVLASLMLGGCVTSGISSMFSSSGPSSSTGPTTTADGTQQFPVPASGRVALRQRLAQLVTEPIQEARISNAWRTPASARVTPNDYATCVSATTASGTRNFIIVVSGGGSATGDVISGSAATRRCSDPTRVTQWTAFSEAVAAR